MSDCGCGTCDDCAQAALVFTTVEGTCCDRDRVNNVWVEGADESGAGGICLLDTLNRAQIVGILKCDDRARADLKRVTSNADLLDLTETVVKLTMEEPGDRLQTQMGANKLPESIPFYAIFRGQPPFAQ